MPKRICPICGTELEADEIFCTTCGARLPEQTTQIKKKSHTPLIVGLVVIAIAAIGGTAVFFHQRSDTTDSTATAEDTSTAAGEESSAAAGEESLAAAGEESLATAAEESTAATDDTSDTATDFSTDDTPDTTEEASTYEIHYAVTWDQLTEWDSEGLGGFPTSDFSLTGEYYNTIADYYEVLPGDEDTYRLWQQIYGETDLLTNAYINLFSFASADEALDEFNNQVVAEFDNNYDYITDIYYTDDDHFYLFFMEDSVGSESSCYYLLGNTLLYCWQGADNDSYSNAYDCMDSIVNDSGQLPTIDDSDLIQFEGLE